MSYTATYQQTDWGTERLLTVKDKAGRIVGQVDPFPYGIPVDPKCRARMLKLAAQRIIAGA
jgi:hypothetical protein